MHTRALLVATVLGLAGAMLGGEAHATNAWPDSDGIDPYFGYFYTWFDLYPADNGHVSWKAYVNGGGAVPTRDALILLDAIDNKWEPLFDYALVAGGYRQFDFQGVAHNQFAEASYMRGTQAEVDYVCQVANAIACFAPAVIISHSIPGPDRYVVVTAVLAYGPQVWNQPNNQYFTHAVAHEWGHGFGLGHHSGCTSVMGPFTCTNIPTPGDVVTALGTVYGY